MIKILLVEDTQTTREFLTYILNKDEELQVIGVVENGKKAIEFLANKLPDVVVMDVHMPMMNGFETTRQIMEKYSIPVVLISASWTPEDIEKTSKAMDTGAVCILRKPSGFHCQEEIKQFIQKIKLMSEIKVVTRKPRFQSLTNKTLLSPYSEERLNVFQPKIVAIGASLGGPNALKMVLEKLQPPFSLPIVILQHITSGFTKELTQWLQLFSLLPIQLAEDGLLLQPGKIYFAPDEFHLKIKEDLRVELTKDPAEHGFRPSVSYLFRSLSGQLAHHTLAVLLTGMGKDGAQELKILKDKGAFTIAQDEATSIIHGMPGEAIKLNGASLVLPIQMIGSKIALFAQQKIS